MVINTFSEILVIPAALWTAFGVFRLELLMGLFAYYSVINKPMETFRAAGVTYSRREQVLNKIWSWSKEIVWMHVPVVFLLPMPVLVNTVLYTLTFSASFWVMFGAFRAVLILMLRAIIVVHDACGMDGGFEVSGKLYFRQDLIDLVRSQAKEIVWGHAPVALLLWGAYQVR